MYNNNQRQQTRISTDKFGNSYQLKGMKPNDEGTFPKCFVELGGKLYKIVVSPSNNEKYSHWCQVTLMKKQQRATSM